MKHLNVISLIANALACGFNTTSVGIAIFNDNLDKATLFAVFLLFNMICLVISAENNK